MTLRPADIAAWTLPECADIVSLSEMAYIVQDWRGLRPIHERRQCVIVTSGGYDPIHPGHVTSLSDSKSKVLSFHQKAYGRSHVPLNLIVLVNGTRFLEKKKSREFMPLKARCQVVSAIAGVDFVVPLFPSNPDDMTVCEPLMKIKPDYFTKGGDRTGIENIPEWSVCKSLGVEIITGCGDEKFWSSSDILDEYAKYVLKTHE